MVVGPMRSHNPLSLKSYQIGSPMKIFQKLKFSLWTSDVLNFQQTMMIYSWLYDDLTLHSLLRSSAFYQTLFFRQSIFRFLILVSLDEYRSTQAFWCFLKLIRFLIGLLCIEIVLWPDTYLINIFFTRKCFRKDRNL